MKVCAVRWRQWCLGVRACNATRARNNASYFMRNSRKGLMVSRGPPRRNTSRGVSPISLDSPWRCCFVAVSPRGSASAGLSRAHAAATAHTHIRIQSLARTTSKFRASSSRARDPLSSILIAREGPNIA